MLRVALPPKALPAKKLSGTLPFTFLLALAPALGILVATIGAGGTHEFLLTKDFRAFYAAGRLVLEGDCRNLFDLEAQFRVQQRFWPELTEPSQTLGFFNPPVLAAPLALVAALPPAEAYFLWTTVNVALLAGLSWGLVDALGGAGLRSRHWAIALPLLFLPVILTLLQGQLSIALALALLLAWRALRRGHEIRGGLWLALLFLKPQLLPAPVLVLLWKRRWLALRGLAVGGTALLVGSCLLVGPETLLAQVRMLMMASTWGDAYGIHPRAMQTWRGALHALLGTDQPAAVQIPWLLGVGGLLGVLVWGWRGAWQAGSHRFDLQFALLVVVAFLCSPHGYSHDLTLLAVPGVLAARAAAASPGPGHGALRTALAALPAVGFAAIWVGIFVLAWRLALPVNVAVMLLAVALLAAGARRVEER